jgi:tetratricopeptide (TPR) repeat protein
MDNNGDRVSIAGNQINLQGAQGPVINPSGDVHQIYNNITVLPPRPTIDLAEAQQQLERLPLDRVPEPAPVPPNSRVQLSANPFFVGRESDLKTLAAILKQGTPAIAAATGMGGIGKTQLASEFVHRYGQYFAGGVYWLSFAEADGVESEIVACGTAMDLPGFAALDFPKQVARVRQIWQEPVPRLLIFDNCEDEALLRKYRPKVGGCRVLVTSRRQRWDDALGIHEHRLDTLPRAASIALLRRFRPDLPEDDRDLSALAAALGDLPLALHVAGSYLKRYKQSPAQYLEKLRSAPLQQFALRALSNTPTEHERDVALTLAVSYQRLDADDPIDALALTLLTRAAHFAPGEPIPHALLQAILELSDEQVLDFEDALIRLDELGLSGPGDETIRLHRLIVAFMLSVSNDDRAQAAVERVLIDEGSKRIDSGYPAQLQPILAHLRHVQQGADPRGDAQAAELADTLGRAEQMLTNYRAARPLLERALSIREQVLGPEHPDTAASLNNLGNSLERLGEYGAARSLFEQALSIREQVLGPEHPDTAYSLNNLALLMSHQGEYETARALYERVVQILERTLGPEHPDTAQCLNNLAVQLERQGKYEQARPLYERAFSIHEQTLGSLHPLTAQSLNNLAELLRAQGEYEQARPLYERALSIHEQALGPDHPSTAVSLNNLAELLRAQGKNEQARPLFERALAICERSLGVDHPMTRIIRGNVADPHS